MIPLIFLFSNFYQQYLFNELVKQSKMITTTPIIKGTSDLTYIFIYLPKYIYLDRSDEWKSQWRLIFNKVVTILTQNWTRTGLGENRFVDHFLSRSHNSPSTFKKKPADKQDIFTNQFAFRCLSVTVSGTERKNVCSQKQEKIWSVYKCKPLHWPSNFPKRNPIS